MLLEEILRSLFTLQAGDNLVSRREIVHLHVHFKLFLHRFTPKIRISLASNCLGFFLFLSEAPNRPDGILNGGNFGNSGEKTARNAAHR